MDASHKFRAKVGRPFKYPYEAWFDGNTRIITRPADFQCQADTMADLLRRRARSLGGHCPASPVGDSAVKFCFYAEGEEAGNE